MRSNIKNRQNSFFKCQLPKHKTAYVKFQTSVSCIWSLMGILLTGASVQLGISYIYFSAWASWADCRNIKPNMSSFLTSVSLYLYFERNIAYWIVNPTWQNSFFKSRLPKHKTAYVKFQTSVSLYLDFNGNIAKWSVSPTWNFLYIFYGMSSNVMAWQNSLFMSRLPKHKTQNVKFQTSVSLYLYFNGNIANWIVNPT